MTKSLVNYNGRVRVQSYIAVIKTNFYEKKIRRYVIFLTIIRNGTGSLQTIYILITIMETLSGHHTSTAVMQYDLKKFELF